MVSNAPSGTGTLPFPSRLANSNHRAKPDEGEAGKHTPPKAATVNLRTTGRDVSSYREGDRK